MHDVDNILNMPLFYNENFMTGNEPFFLKTLYDRGIRFVRDIAIDSKSFLNKTQIEMSTGKAINFMLYEGLVKSIKTLFNKLNLNFNKNDVQIAGPSLSCYAKFIVCHDSKDKSIYKKLIKRDVEPICKSKWTDFVIADEEWKHIFRTVFSITRDSYIQWFQVRIIYNILGTNSLMFKMKLLKHNICTFCKQCEETLMHLFWNCQKVKSLIEKINETLFTKMLSNCLSEIDCKLFMLGSTKPEKLSLNMLCLEVKRYIFKCRKDNCIPNYDGLLHSLAFSYKVYNSFNISEIEATSWSLIRNLCGPNLLI